MVASGGSGADQVQIQLCHFLCCVTSDKLLSDKREVIIVSRFSGCWKDGLGLGLVQSLKHCLAHSKQSIQGSYYEVRVNHLILRRRKLRFLSTCLRSSSKKELMEMLKEPPQGLDPVPGAPSPPLATWT